MKMKFLLPLLVMLVMQLDLRAQCGPLTPSFTVNLVGNPGGTWFSPNVVRQDQCCGNTGVVCVKFVIYLDSAAVGINFTIFSGAVPSGALYYQVNCGPQIPVGQPICLSGPGPHVLTFCKPGNNANVYSIQSIPAAVGGTDITVSNGCIKTLNATGFNTSTTQWYSINPGTQGQYNNFLSCTSNCLNPTVTPIGTPPPFIDYVVCGQPAAQCNFQTVCDTVRVYFTPPMTVSIVPQNPTICFGQSATSLTANGSGGLPPYNYLWNNVNPSQTINVGVGTYNVSMSDASGCPPVTASVTVTAFTVAINANAGPNQVLCSQNPIATINGSVSGAAGGIWSGGQGTFSPNNTTVAGMQYTPTAGELAAGSATLYLTTTGNGTCPPDVDTVVLSYQPFTGTVTPTVTNVSCFGGTNGSANITVTGGAAPHTFQWNTVPAQSTATATNLPIGTYSVTITNAIGCTYTTSATITQPPPLGVSSVVSNVSCFNGNNGSIAATPSGGTSPYTYSWQPGGQTGQTAVNLTAGTYTLTVTDFKGCQITATYTVTQPPVLAVSLTPTNIQCNSGSNGAVTTTVTGGTPGYTYSWSPGGSTGQNLAGVGAGTYTVVVTDNHNCTVSSSITLTQPPVLTASATSTNETCDYSNNGTATVIAGGGSSPYTYSWQPGAQTTTSISNLIAGTYTCTVTDLQGCTAIAFATVTQPAPLISPLLNQVNVSCFNGSNGSITANPSGGTPNYTYAWTPGGATTSTASNLTAGSYSVTVTDANGCTVQNNITITQPTPLTSTPVITNVSCFAGSNGTISVTAGGGIPPYSYLWLPGGQNTAAITGLPAGTYSLTITDAMSCPLNVTYTVTQPPLLTVGFTSTNVSCFNGSDGTANSVVNGGTTPYSYNWSPGGAATANVTGLLAGTYTLTVTDNLSCTATNTVVITQPTALTASTTATNETCDYLNNGSSTVTAAGGTPGYTYLWSAGSQTTTTVNGLASGTYSVTVTDAEGCVITVTSTITQPATLITPIQNQVNVSCFGGSNGSAFANPSGGTPNYLYSWSPGGATTATAPGLSANTYTVTVTDANGCTAQSTVTITQPTLITVTPSSLPASCNGASNGSASTTASGGIGPYTFNWMPGSMAGQNISNLTAGTYSVTATDANGCVMTNTVTVTQPTPIVLTTSTTNSNCGTSTGSASVVAAGGVPGYTYAWSPVGGTGTTASNLFSGAYTIQVTDANGCIATQFANVNDNAAPVATITSFTNVTCFGGNNGAAIVGVTGGTGPFTYSWTPSGGNASAANGLIAGSYTVTATGFNGCQGIATVVITQPPLIVLTVTTAGASCFGASNGTATVTATGGVPNYSYTWQPGGTTGSSVSGLANGTYTVQATDNNSCIQTTTYTISQPSAPLAVSGTTTPTSCFGGSNGTASATSSGGTSPYNYNWMPGNFNSQNIFNLTAGIYTVTTTDNNGCTAVTTATVSQPTIISLTPSSVNSDCGNPNGLGSVIASGGTPGYTYSWSPGGATSSIVSGLLSGSYTVTVNDLNSCVATTTVVINNNPAPSVSVSSVTNVSCNNGANGTATATVVGGTGPFQFAWAPSGGNAQTATGLTPGTYTVTVTAANSCVDTAISTAITQPFPIVMNVTPSPASCFGGTNGSASVIANGGTPGYTFTWLPGGTSGNTVSGLATGTYSVQATDLNNCIQTTTYTITEPTALTAGIVSTSSVSCFGGANGSATTSVSGGTPFYSYSWSPSGGNGPTGNGFAAGNYTVTVTDFNGCTTTAVAVIAQPAQALSATSTSTPPSCFGGSNGTATVNPSGGTPAYSYNWAPTGSGQMATGLTMGSYTVIVTDANSCQTNISFNITQPTPMSGSLLTVDPSCGLNNGSITTQISGATPPYSYSWQPTPSAGAALTNVGAGTYTVQVTDAGNCVSTYTATLTNIPGPTLSITAVTATSCFGGSNGTATIGITQGTAPFSIVWSPNGGNANTGTGLSAGTYTATVTDGLGCVATVTTSITEPTQINIPIASSTDVSCNGGNDGSVTVAPTGGTPGYTYSWAAPLSSTSPTVNNLAVGTYTVNVMDSQNCPASVSVVISEPTVLSSAVSSISNPLCFNSTGSASVLASGGTAPYTYAWTSNPVQSGSTATNITAGTYSVTITDANGCVTSNTVTLSQPAQIITSITGNDTICLGQSGSLSVSASGGSGGFIYAWQPSGAITSTTFTVSPTVSTTYTVIAYDVNGCAGTSDTASILVYTLSGANIDMFGTTPICPGQGSTIYAVPNGSTGPLTYTWSHGLGSGPGAFVVVPTQPTTYSVTVSNSCGITIVDTIQVLFNPQPTIVLSSDTSKICAPGLVAFFDNSVTGNVNDPITSWYWTFGDGTSSSLQNPVHIYTSTGTFTVNLSVSTSGGCTNSSSSAPLIINAYPYPVASFSVNSTYLDIPYDVLVCTNQSTGAIIYNWNFGDGSTSTATNPQHLYATVGNFNVQLVATNVFGCSDTAVKQIETSADVIFPNAFTPNNDGSNGGSYSLNDLTNNVFYPFTSGVVDYKLQIFNRWGELIFESLDIRTGWDGYYRGKLCQGDVYIWKAYLKLNNGKTFNKIGDVTLLR